MLGEHSLNVLKVQCVILNKYYIVLFSKLLLYKRNKPLQDALLWDKNDALGLWDQFMLETSALTPVTCLADGSTVTAMLLQEMNKKTEVNLMRRTVLSCVLRLCSEKLLQR